MMEKKSIYYFAPLFSWKEIKLVKIIIFPNGNFSTKIYLQNDNNNTNTQNSEYYWNIKVMRNACLSGEWREITGQEAVLIV